jgi:hypothetical protein
MSFFGPGSTSHLEHVVKWAEDNKLSIEPSKCHVTLFTPNTREVNSCPPVFIRGVAIPLNKNPKWLGLNMDPMHKCTYHVDNSSIAKANSHLQLLKAISGQDFGDKETLLLTYKAYMKPALGYAGVIWFPVVGPEAGCVKRAQRTQNSAMRVITGNHKMASVDHLLAETELLPVKDHLGLICKQFLANASQVDHPSHETIKLPTGTRPGRKAVAHTLQSRYGHEVEPFLQDGILPPAAVKRTLKEIHTKVVADHKRTLVNKVLGSSPPPVDPSEQTLGRPTRCTLTQLRSDYCKNLKTYQARIGTAPNDLCPECLSVPHTSKHVFNCPSLPTSLTVRSLWSHPREAADFLRSSTSFANLPPNPPLPRPPPEPPPIARAPLTLYRPPPPPD